MLKNNIMKEESKEKENSNNIKKENGNIIINYEPNLDIHSKRSYSCKVKPL